MLSIVTGTLNRVHLLDGLIKNTVERDERLELVLVDGGSTDGTIQYLRECNHERVTVIEVGKRTPYPHFMNLGIRASKFEWICQWNDDVLLFGKWDKVFQKLTNDADAYCFSWVDSKKLVQGKTACMYFLDCLNYGIYNRRVFQKIGLYYSGYDYYHCDCDMFQRAELFNMRIEYCPDIKVIELSEEKRAKITDTDRMTPGKTIPLYQMGLLPDDLEYLE